VVAVIIGLLHPGMMGAAVGGQLAQSGHRVNWCPAGRSPATADRAQAAGLRPVGSLAELLAGSEVVFSLCPPANAEHLARQIAEHRFNGLFVEANAIQPARMTHIAALVTAAGATVVDGSVIGPPPSGERTARMYLSGPPVAVDTVQRLLVGSQTEPRRVDDRIGAASALKMAYGSFQKISRALAAVSHALADDFGVGEHLLAEARDMHGTALADRATVPSVAARAWRWAPEMDEVAATLRDAGLPDVLAAGASEVFHRWDTDKDQWDIDPDTALRHLRD
jgi:3-hydroxyisobutyrate dehydrogenase-like beta-hydroxyacid dehydrogenase